MLDLSGISNKEIVQLRLKCLEPFVHVASKANIEQATVIKIAEKAWEFATKGIDLKDPETTVKVTDVTSDQPPVQ